MTQELSPEDRDLLARTIVGEAANQPFEGQQAVASVVLNRLRSGQYGKSVRDVVLAPHQFEPWQTRSGELQALDPAGRPYRQASAAIDAALTGDNTGGATHFLEPNIVRGRTGGSLPKWAQGPSLQIGDHLFFHPGGPAPSGVPIAGTPTKSTASQGPFSVPAPQKPAPSSLGQTFALMGDTQLPTLTPLVNSQQMRPQPPEPDVGSDVLAVFQPRTTKRVAGIHPKV